jgi:CDGSH iron-sulfur domain-containing protein 3
MAMDERVVAQPAPFPAVVEAGKAYWWCACGRSATQPFCDGSHKVTSLTPVKWVAATSGEVWFCGCKRTGTPPLCDGSHNALAG